MSKRFGPTGEFPRTKIAKDDNGELKIGIAADYANQIVRVDFGIPTTWIGFPAADARKLAALLIKNADALDGMKT